MNFTIQTGQEQGAKSVPLPITHNLVMYELF
jgi:hypothetical protein